MSSILKYTHFYYDYTVKQELNLTSTLQFSEQQLAMILQILFLLILVLFSLF